MCERLAAAMLHDRLATAAAGEHCDAYCALLASSLFLCATLIIFILSLRMFDVRKDLAEQIPPRRMALYIAGLVFMAAVITYYVCWCMIHLFYVAWPIENPLRPSENSIIVVQAALWVTTFLVGVTGYSMQKRIIVPHFIYFSGLSTLGSLCHYALTLRRVLRGTITTDSSDFVLQTVISSLAITHLVIYAIAVWIDECVKRRRMRMRREMRLARRRALAARRFQLDRIFRNSPSPDSAYSSHLPSLC